MLRQPPTASADAARTPRGGQRAGPPLRHFWQAGVMAVVGLSVTTVAGWQMDRWARARDQERFEGESRLVMQMIEQKRERYESALARLRDAYARDNGEMPYANWIGPIDRTVGLAGTFPNVRCLVVAPRVTQEQRAGFEQRAKAQVTDHPGSILTARAQAEHWFPVWRRFDRAGLEVPPLGDDLLAETPQHPSFEPALGFAVGWVAERPVRLKPEGADPLVGFWFVIPLRPLEFTNQIQWKRPYESETQADQRRVELRAREATGLLAAFIGGDLFLEDFNHESAMVRVQLFTSSTPTPESLVNPGHAPPPKPRQVKNEIMPWYGRSWTARLASTPRLEAASLRFRTWVVWGVGATLSLGAAAALAWQTRGRWREAALARQLREVLARQERLSRDLHDGTLQSVYGIGLALQRAQRLVDKRPQEAACQISETTRVLQQVIGEMRDFIRESDPTTREEVPLSEALAGVVANLKLGTEMELQLNVAPNADRGLTPAQSLHLLNIAREGLSNSVRHSGARLVRINLERSNGVLRLEVADDGCGFDPPVAQLKGRGLANLAARVRELGGVPRWETTAGQGARLIVEAPLAPTSTPKAS